MGARLTMVKSSPNGSLWRAISIGESSCAIFTGHGQRYVCELYGFCGACRLCRAWNLRRKRRCSVKSADRKNSNHEDSHFAEYVICVANLHLARNDKSKIQDASIWVMPWMVHPWSQGQTLNRGIHPKSRVSAVESWGKSQGFHLSRWQVIETLEDGVGAPSWGPWGPLGHGASKSPLIDDYGQWFCNLVWYCMIILTEYIILLGNFGINTIQRESRYKKQPSNQGYPIFGRSVRCCHGKQGRWLHHINQSRQYVIPSGYDIHSSPWKIWKIHPFLRTVNHLFLWAIYTMAMLVITRG